MNRIGRRPPMPHVQPLRDPGPSHRRFLSQFFRHSGFNRIFFSASRQWQSRIQVCRPFAVALPAPVPLGRWDF